MSHPGIEPGSSGQVTYGGLIEVLDEIEDARTALRVIGGDLAAATELMIGLMQWRSAGLDYRPRPSRPGLTWATKMSNTSAVSSPPLLS